MIPDIDIYRVANLLVKRHGQDAPIEAAMRADKRPGKGEGQHFCRRHMTKGQLTMAVATIYPEPQKGGRGRRVGSAIPHRRVGIRRWLDSHRGTWEDYPRSIPISGEAYEPEQHLRQPANALQSQQHLDG